MHFNYLFLYYLLTILVWAHTALYLVCVSPYSVSGLSWYQHQSLAPFWLSSSPGALVRSLASYSVNHAYDSLIPPQILLSVFSSPCEIFTLSRFNFTLLLVMFLFFTQLLTLPLGHFITNCYGPFKPEWHLGWFKTCPVICWHFSALSHLTTIPVVARCYGKYAKWVWNLGSEF